MSRCLSLLILLFGVTSIATANTQSSQVSNADRVKVLLDKYCVDCHGPKAQKGDFRIDELDPDIVNGKDADYWHEVLNLLNEGEMPPKKKPQPTTDELTTLTTWLESELHKAAAKRLSTGGRQLMRRMSRYEYQYTLEDLLGIALDYTDLIPDDLSGEDGLKTNASLLGMSLPQTRSYMHVLEQALDEAIPDGPEHVFKESITKLAVSSVRGQRRPKRVKNKDKNKKNTSKPRYIAPTPSWDLRSSNFVHDLPRKVTFNDRPFAGRFLIRIEAIGKASSDGREPELTIQVGHRASGDYDPKKVMGSAIVKADGKPQTIEFVGNIEDFPLGKKDGYYNGSGSHNVTHLSVYVWNTSLLKNKITPDTSIDELEEPLIEPLSVAFEGPLLAGYPSKTAKNLLPDSPNQNNESVYAGEVLSAFLQRAYRRPIDEAELIYAVESFNRFRKLTPDFKSAMRRTMAMALMSPKFLYLVEPAEANSAARKLNPFELATRLSYFLWASMPDDELLSLAATGELTQPDVLKSQVTRMRQDAKFQRFVKHFAEQWLGLAAMDNVAVNPSVHRDFSDKIRENLKQETLAFAAHVFTNDLSCRNFIDSEFAVLNQVTAGHYGIDNVNGLRFRPVTLAANDPRGGVLTHGSISLMGSDGTDSNPIYRGVWLNKRLFADPPPPPGAPPLDKENPDLNKLTLKEQIELHREEAACARCHKNIDPWGIAFEHYDATGRWRNPDKPTKKRGQTVIYDATAELPDGHTIKGMDGLKAYLIKNRSTDLAIALARRMSGYALGRNLEFSDDELIDTLTQQFKDSDYRISSLIEAIVTSDTFLTK